MTKENKIGTNHLLINNKFTKKVLANKTELPQS